MAHFCAKGFLKVDTQGSCSCPAVLWDERRAVVHPTCSGKALSCTMGAYRPGVPDRPRCGGVRAAVLRPRQSGSACRSHCINIRQQAAIPSLGRSATFTHQGARCLGPPARHHGVADALPKVSDAQRINRKNAEPAAHVNIRDTLLAVDYPSSNELVATGLPHFTAEIGKLVNQRIWLLGGCHDPVVSGHECWGIEP